MKLSRPSLSPSLRLRGLLMSFSISVAGLLAPPTGLWADSRVVLEWIGNYVTGDSNVRGYNTPIVYDVPLEGGGLGARWHCPLSDVDPLTPIASVGVGKCWRFFGGVLMESYTNDFAYRWAEIWNQGVFDELYSGGPPGSHGWDFRYWKKADFLNGGSSAPVTFNGSTVLLIEGYAGGDGIPDANSGRVRFVVKDGNQFYISEDFAGPEDTEDAFFLLNNPNARKWATYSPTPPFGLRFDVAAATFAPHTFTDVTAIGYMHTNHHVPPPVSPAKAGFTFRRFLVSADVGVTTSAAVNPTAVEEGIASLSPNPARKHVLVRYALRREGEIDLAVYDVGGRRVEELVHGRRDAGEHLAGWDRGSHAPGIYFVRLTTPAGSFTAKTTLLP